MMAISPCPSPGNVGAGFDLSRYVGLREEAGTTPLNPQRMRRSSRTHHWEIMFDTPAPHSLATGSGAHVPHWHSVESTSNILRQINLDRLALQTKTGLGSEGGGIFGDVPGTGRISKIRSRQKAELTENSDGVRRESQTGIAFIVRQKIPLSSRPDHLEADTLPGAQNIKVQKWLAAGDDPTVKNVRGNRQGSEWTDKGNFTKYQFQQSDHSRKNDSSVPFQTQLSNSTEDVRGAENVVRRSCPDLYHGTDNLASGTQGAEWEPPGNQLLQLVKRSSRKRSQSVNDANIMSNTIMESGTLGILRRVNGATRAEAGRRGTLVPNTLTLSLRRRGLDDISEDVNNQSRLRKDSDEGSHNSYYRPVKGRAHTLGLSTEMSAGDRLSLRRGNKVPIKMAGSRSPQLRNRRSGSTCVEVRRRAESDATPVGGASNAPKSRRGTWAFENDAPSHFQRFRGRGQAHLLFKTSARKVMLVLQWMRVLSKQDERIETKLKTFFDIAQELDDGAGPKRSIQDEAGLAFDPRVFKAKRAIDLTYDQKRILTLCTDFRTPDNISKVIAGLHHLEAFAEYPLHMQEKLAKVAWYQELPAKKMIIRQGHKAENFYFILSGSAIAKQLVRDEATGNVNMRVVARIQRGESFGEVALVQHTERTATVESVTPMQLLVVSREDFMDIFFARKPGSEPDHIIFCRSINFLQDWPVEKCLEEPRSCLFHYFRRGTVIVSDSRSNEWIYIVKTGTCTVLKKLRSGTPQKSSCMQRHSVSEMPVKLPRDGTSIPGPRVNTRLSFSTPSMSSSAPVSARTATAGSTQSSAATTLPAIHTQSSTLVNRPTLERGKSVTFLEPDDAGTERSSARPRLHMSFPPPPRVPSPPMSSKSESLPISESAIQGGYKTSFSRSKFKKFPMVMEAYIRSVEALTLANRFSFESLAETPRSPTRESSIEKDPCFVQLQKLRPRDVFGLEEAVYEEEGLRAVDDDDDESSVTLVSNGAELIMLSRKFFMKHASATVKKHVREIAHPFPTEDTLQNNLQTKLDWEIYRKDMVNDLVTQKTEEKCLQIVV